MEISKSKVKENKIRSYKLCIRELNLIIMKYKRRYTKILKQLSFIMKENRLLKDKIFHKYSNYEDIKQFYSLDLNDNRKFSKKIKTKVIRKFSFIIGFNQEYVRRLFSFFEMDFLTNAVGSKKNYKNLRILFNKIDKLKMDNEEEFLKLKIKRFNKSEMRLLDSNNTNKDDLKPCYSNDDIRKDEINNLNKSSLNKYKKNEKKKNTTREYFDSLYDYSFKDKSDIGSPFMSPIYKKERRSSKKNHIKKEEEESPLMSPINMKINTEVMSSKSIDTDTESKINDDPFVSPRSNNEFEDILSPINSVSEEIESPSRKLEFDLNDNKAVVENEDDEYENKVASFNKEVSPIESNKFKKVSDGKLDNSDNIFMESIGPKKYSHDRNRREGEAEAEEVFQNIINNGSSFEKKSSFESIMNNERALFENNNGYQEDNLSDSKKMMSMKKKEEIGEFFKNSSFKLENNEKDEMKEYNNNNNKEEEELNSSNIDEENDTLDDILYKNMKQEKSKYELRSSLSEDIITSPSKNKEMKEIDSGYERKRKESLEPNSGSNYHANFVNVLFKRKKIKEKKKRKKRNAAKRMKKEQHKKIKRERIMNRLKMDLGTLKYKYDLMKKKKEDKEIENLKKSLEKFSF